MKEQGRDPGAKFVTDLCIGGAAAIVSKTAVAPIERIKLLLQVQHSYAGIASEHRYSGIIDALRRVPREQGVLSFWRGNATNVIRYFPTQALNFAFNDLIRSRITTKNEAKDTWSYLGRSMAAGGVAGSVTMCFVYPLDFIRTRLSVDVAKSNEHRDYKGIVDCARKTVATDGLRGLYRGFFISIQTYFIYRAVYFGLYDTARGVYEEGRGRGQGDVEKRRLPFIASFCLAETVTVCASYLTYPWDTIRRRMMIKGELMKSSTLQAVRRVIANEGFRGLYKGAFANILRSTGSALVISLYHEIQSRINF